MSTTTAVAIRDPPSWRSHALTAASTTVKIAQGVTSDVPIVSQILSVVAQIVDIVDVRDSIFLSEVCSLPLTPQKAEKSNDALRVLATRSATIAGDVEQTVSGRSVDGKLLARLERLREYELSLKSKENC